MIRFLTWVRYHLRLSALLIVVVIVAGNYLDWPALGVKFGDLRAAIARGIAPSVIREGSMQPVIPTPAGGFAATATATPIPSVTPTTTQTPTLTPTATTTPTAVPATASATATATQTATKPPATVTASPTNTPSPTPTMTRVATVCAQTTPPILGVGVYATWDSKACKWNITTVGATAVPMPTGAASASPVSASTTPGASVSGKSVVVTTLQDTRQMGTWNIRYYTGATQLMKDFLFVDPDKTWAEFPNVNWSPAGFVSKNGVEYGKYIDTYCQQGQTCDIIVPARSYRLITGDYDIAGVGKCEEATGIGCAVMLFNVGDVTAALRDQRVDAGFTVTGLYWNGDENDQAISALASHTAYRMIGVPKGNPANPGANCSVPTGCTGVNITFGILSGNELLVLGQTIAR